MMFHAKSSIIIITHYNNLDFKEKIQNESGIAYELEKETLIKILTFINIPKVIIVSVTFWLLKL